MYQYTYIKTYRAPMCLARLVRSRSVSITTGADPALASARESALF